MDLYGIPFTCSFAAHVALLEADLPHTLRFVDRRTKRLDDGRDFLALAPHGAVPALELPGGEVLSESSAVLQWIADAAPGKGLAPPAGFIERYRLMEWLNFITTELHKKHVWMIFSTRTTEAMKEWARASAPGTLDVVARHLTDRAFVLGDRFTVADAYLFWTLLVLPHGGFPLDRWPALLAYADRVRARESVKRAIEVETPLLVRERAAAAAAA